MPNDALTSVTSDSLISAQIGTSTATLAMPLLTPALTTALATEAHSTVDEIDAAPVSPNLDSQPASLPASSSSESPSDQPASVSWKSVVKPSDDPVLAELERTELQESELAESKSNNSELGNAAPAQPEVESVAPLYPSSRQQPKQRGPLVALLMFVLLCAGLYVAWMYEPGFRAFVQPQIDRLMTIGGAAPRPQSAPPGTPNPVPVLQTSSISTSAPADSTNAPNQTPSTAPDSAAGSATTSSATPATTPPIGTPSAAIAPSVPLVAKSEAGESAASKGESKKDDALTSSSATPLPGENTAIILSSKGAEKRLDHSVPPKFPAEARSGQAQGTVVLKAVIDENGQVEGVRLVEGNAVLASAAIEAVKLWHYRPYMRDGKPQPFQTVVIVDFQRP